MKEIFAGVWQTTLENPFPGLNTHAYLIQRVQGNALFYNTSNEFDLQEIQELGGIVTQFVSHRHESGSSLKTIKSMFNSKLCASELEAPHLAEKADSIVTEQTLYSEDIVIIPTPGHTDGGLSFFYKPKEGKSILFTGDTLFQSNNEWSTFIYAADGGSRSDMLQTLECYRKLHPGIVISSGYSGDRCIVEIDQIEWSSTIDSIISNL